MIIYGVHPVKAKFLSVGLPAVTVIWVLASNIAGRLDGLQSDVGGSDPGTNVRALTQ